MRTKGKALLVVLCVASVLIASAFGTMAYLTDDTGMTNTFTVGSVEITLDEAKVDEYGVKDGDFRIATGNTYKLIPGRTYTKDPTVHVTKGSEPCWLFVKVVNNIASVEIDPETPTETKIASQMTANGWTALDGKANVYWHEVVDAREDQRDVKIFESFTVDGDGVTKDTLAGLLSTFEDNNPLTEATGNAVIVTAYAVQADGFDSANTDAENAKAAWDAAGFES